MPELPEVETVARELRAVLPGKKIRSLELYWEKTFEHQDAPPLPGQRFGTIGRQGKYLLLNLDKSVLVIHLRMTGQLLVRRSGQQARHSHDRVRFLLNDGLELIFRDSRKFGRIRHVLSAEPLLRKLGTDAMDQKLTAALFGSMLQKSAMNIKAFLLSQKYIAGLGNIYVDEALFLSALHPLTPAREVSGAEPLFNNIRLVLQRSIDNMGSTISDYRNTKGNEGLNQRYFNVYGRQGLPCKKCGGPIEKIRVAGRGTHICPRCQQRGKT